MKLAPAGFFSQSLTMIFWTEPSALARTYTVSSWNFDRRRLNGRRLLPISTEMPFCLGAVTAEALQMPMGIVAARQMAMILAATFSLISYERPPDYSFRYRLLLRNLLFLGRKPKVVLPMTGSNSRSIAGRINITDSILMITPSHQVAHGADHVDVGIKPNSEGCREEAQSVDKNRGNGG